MAERRAGGKAAAVVEETPDVETPAEEKDSSPEEFNQNVKNLVALYAQEIFQDLEQRVRDLEMLAGQPQGAVTFLPGPAVAQDVTVAQDREVPWYTSPGGV